jgi:TolB protein
MRYFLVLAALCISCSATAQHGAVGVFSEHGDIGNPTIKGTAVYDSALQTYELGGSGYNIWFNRDQFQFCYKKIRGNFILTADFAFLGDTGNPHRKIGWMVRESADPQAAQICAVSHRDGLTVLQWRALTGAFMRDPQDEIRASKTHYQTIQLERRGNLFIMRTAHPGEPLQEVGEHQMADLPDSVLAGLFICAHDSTDFARVRIWNVRIDVPAGGASAQVLGSRMEIMDVFTGIRKVIYTAPGRFEAPNWIPDGDHLLFNARGALYTIPVTGGIPQQLNTGSARQINNDHGISFDGKMLAISSSRQGLPGGGSTVYVLSLTGGEPQQVTEATPAYFHGWAPNGKQLVFVGKQGGSVYNIYKLTLKDRSIFPLTTDSTGHVDGCEYSPDGRYVYYNGNQSGTMQLWRMKPDGSGKEQLTFDEWNNWFPHLSPDGKWIVFLSYPSEVDPADHPSYKNVLIRLMPTQGGAPRVIANLYGGQGTMNVPCWSPDSHRIAFVSNSVGF